MANLPAKLQLILPKTEANADVPLRYDLSVTNRAPMNSYIFEETLFPLTTEPPSMESGGQGSSVPDSELSNRAYRKFKRQQERRRKMALVGTVAHECTVTPIVDATYRQVMTQRQKLASQPKRTIKMIDDRAMQGKQSGNFSSFIRSNTGSNKVKGSGQDGLRNARLPHDELLDLLFECFEKYEYWPLRSLREHLKQPEVSTDQWTPSMLTHTGLLERSSRDYCLFAAERAVRLHVVTEARVQVQGRCGSRGFEKRVCVKCGSIFADRHEHGWYAQCRTRRP